VGESGRSGRVDNVDEVRREGKWLVARKRGCGGGQWSGGAGEWRRGGILQDQQDFEEIDRMGI
jgi:hypothetical protein